MKKRHYGLFEPARYGKGISESVTSVARFHHVRPIALFLIDHKLNYSYIAVNSDLWTLEPPDSDVVITRTGLIISWIDIVKDVEEV